MRHSCIISFVMVWVSRHGNVLLSVVTATIQGLRLWAKPKWCLLAQVIMLGGILRHKVVVLCLLVSCCMLQSEEATFISSTIPFSTC